MPLFGIEHDEALKGVLVIRRNVDFSCGDLRGEVGDHRGWLPTDQRHIPSIGLLGAISDLAFIACFGLPDHVALFSCRGCDLSCRRRLFSWTPARVAART